MVAPWHSGKTETRAYTCATNSTGRCRGSSSSRLLRKDESSHLRHRVENKTKKTKTKTPIAFLSGFTSDLGHYCPVTGQDAPPTLLQCPHGCGMRSDCTTWKLSHFAQKLLRGSAGGIPYGNRDAKCGAEITSGETIVHPATKRSSTPAGQKMGSDTDSSRRSRAIGGMHMNLFQELLWRLP